MGSVKDLEVRRKPTEIMMGDGVFHYRYIKADDDPGISAWEMYFYNGINIVGQGNQAVFFCGLTGPEDIWHDVSMN